jgi:sugar phosphate isomerase/epimerase
MYKNLNLGLLGHPNVHFEDVVALAKRHGYAGVDLDIAFIEARVRAHGLDRTREWFATTGLRASSVGMNVSWREADSDESFDASLKAFDAQAALAKAFGITRCQTWVMPRSDALSYRQHFAKVVPRLAQCADAAAAHGLRMGLEFVGPATLRAGHPHPFVHTLDGMLTMACAVGDNTGLLLDAFHWWTSHGTEQELRQLHNDDVVYVHVNDARAGLGPDAQIDNQREQAGSTGVIPIKPFLDALRAIKYDGPIAVEPFNAAIKTMTPDEAARRTSAALDHILAM